MGVCDCPACPSQVLTITGLHTLIGWINGVVMSQLQTQERYGTQWLWAVTSSVSGGGCVLPRQSMIRLPHGVSVCGLQCHRGMSQALCPVPSRFLTPLDSVGPASVSGLAASFLSPLRCSPQWRVNPEVAWPTSTSSTRTCCPSSGAITCSWKRQTPMSGLSRAGLLAARPVEEVSAVVGSSGSGGE